MNALNNPITLDTLMTEVNRNVSATVEVSFKVCFSGCIIDYKSLNISIEDMSILFKDNSSPHTHDLKIDITSILFIQSFGNYEYKIDTSDCEIKISL